MTQLGPLFWIVVTLIAAVTDYGVKHMVQSLDDELAAVRRKTVAEQKEIHALTAAWTYLNQPETLADLNKRFLGLVPITAKQMERAIADIPLRPQPPPSEPPQPPALLVAATPHDAVPAGAVATPAAIPAATPAPVAATSVPAPVPAAAMPEPEAAKPLAAIPIDAPSPAPAARSSATPAAATRAAATPAPAPAKTAVPVPAPTLDTLFTQVAGKN